MASLQGLAGILMALLRRQQTGQGDYLDISMHDCMVSASANLLGPALAEDRQQVARHERTTGGSAFYQIYDTADGRHLAYISNEDGIGKLHVLALPSHAEVALPQLPIG